MSAWPDACVDLIYLDPPFNSNADYNILFGNQNTTAGKVKRKDLAQITAFTDTWEWSAKTGERIKEIKRAHAHRARASIVALDSFYKGGTGMLAYLVYMADRIDVMHRVLKDTGSFYLHCDPAASHYLKMILDDVFGAKNFRNEIIWCYHGPGSPGMRQFNRKTDTIFWYSKGDTWTFNKEEVRIPYKDPKQTLRKAMSTTRSFTGDEAEENRRRGKVPENWWEIRIAARSKSEYLGYPTQKPLKLLERIIKASSNQGDVVLDPFCGCGTTVEAAMRLRRDFIGIDISMYALDVIQKERLKDVKFTVDGVPADVRTAGLMARNRPFAFEKWAVHLIPGFVSNNKQTGDGGVDGWAGLLHAPEGEDGICVAQVKGGSPNVESLKALLSQIAGGHASVGVFITLKKWDTPTVRKCIANAGKLLQGASEYDRLVMWSVEEYFAGQKPNLPALANPRTGKPLQSDLMISEPSSLFL